MNVLLAERSSIMSFLELPLLVMFMHNRMSCRTAVQSGFAGTTAPNDPVDNQVMRERIWFLQAMLQEEVQCIVASACFHDTQSSCSISTTAEQTTAFSMPYLAQLYVC